MTTQTAPTTDSIELPTGTLELTSELVPAVRQILRNGLNDEFLRSCVRIGAFQQFGGGRKASLVGGLRIDVHAVLKLGDAELRRHVVTMNAINALRPRTFPLILDTVSPDGKRVFMLMEQLRGHGTLLSKVFDESTPTAHLSVILEKVVEAIRLMHSVRRDSDPLWECLPQTPDPFTARLQSKLLPALRHDKALSAVLQRPGRVLGIPCPPATVLLARAAEVAKTLSARKPLSLVHGDPHLGNVMVRRNGKNAYRVRLIDPNPEIGFSQPLYDVGKLLHWSEPVGWAQAKPEVCRVSWRKGGRNSQWVLDAWCEGHSAAAETRRAHVERFVRGFAESFRASHGDLLSPAVAVAAASAHVGLVALLKGPANRTAKRFVLAHILASLAAAFPAE